MVTLNRSNYCIYFFLFQLRCFPRAGGIAQWVTNLPPIMSTGVQTPEPKESQIQ